MKKILVCALAIAALASCQKNEVLQSSVGPAIAFENAAIDNATRAAADPSTTTENITEFSVWAYMDNTAGEFLTEETVSKNGSAWTYANTQYWYANHKWYFAALSPVKAANVTVDVTDANAYGLGTVNFTNVDGTTDVIYASEYVETGDDVSNMPPVSFTFNHLLSKVKFTFTNGFENPNSTLVITGLKMTAPKAGTIDLAVENWWDNVDDWKLSDNETVTLAFGDVAAGANIAQGTSEECDDERLTIPATETQEYTVTFHVALYNGSVLAVENDLTTTVTGAALEMGKAYNFKAEINASNIMGPEGQLYPIVFNVEEVKDWVEAGDFGVGNNVDTEAELHAAIAKGGDIYLENDITLTSAVTVGKDVEVNLYLNGFNLVATSTDAIVVDGGKLVINGEGEVKAATDDNSSANAVWAYNGAEVTINGGSYYVGADGLLRNDCIYAGGIGKTGGVIYINDGRFEAKVKDTQYWVLNLRGDNADAAIYAMGGTYVNFDPANNLSEGPATNFVPSGYISVPNTDGTYTVVATTALEVKTVEAVAAGETLELEESIVVDGTIKVEGTLDGAGNAIVAQAVPTNNGLVRPVGTATVKNVTIAGEGQSTADGKTLRAIYINDEGTYVIENVVTTGTGYAINVNTQKTVSLTVTDSTLEGWTSFGGSTTATFTDVTFKAGQYATFRPYGTTVLTNCSFPADFTIDLGSQATGCSIKFVNCTYAGVALAEANLTNATGKNVTIE